ncbi:FCS-Like Zinc finger 11-like [Neltuma alba]|uniref:FCS-Like Zinc finger 11-like n=1 Tax=Neltuma alba TaxID=207710 RepID=UPI0010A5005D|nr:FCS-Like Zinc finger 11-like [Prosopis alba]
MLRKRNRSLQKDQHRAGHNWDYHSQSHGLGTNFRNNLIFNIPRLFVGLVPNSLLDSDSMRSPTSPLDVKVVPTSGDTARTPKSCLRSWDCSKVGLSILDSFNDSSEFSGKIISSSESKIPVISPGMKIKFSNCLNNANSFEASKSLPRDFCKLPYTQNRSAIHKGDSNTLFEIGETCLGYEPFRKSWSSSMDSCNPFRSFSGLNLSNYDSDSGFSSVKDMSTQGIFPHFIERNHNSNTSLPTELNSKHVSSLELVESLSAGEIENSEDYTCVISHGPNPKTTHIFGDCILETHSNYIRGHGKNEEKENGVSPLTNCSQTPNQYPSNNFLSFCYHCNKKLDEGKDIYIYRGDEAFCSLTCRDLEIMIDEKLQKSSPSEKSQEQEISKEELFETRIFTTT